MSATAFLFPGQGAFVGGVIAEAALVYPAIRRTLDIVEEVANRRFGRSLLKLLNDPAVTAEDLLVSDPALLQLGVFTLSVAAFEMLQSEGIRPDVLIGHSLGEIAALTCAQVFTLRQGAEVVCDRIEALGAAPHDGCMAALSASPERVRALIAQAVPPSMAQLPSMPTIAVENHDSQTVISGGEQAVALVLKACSEAGISAQRLNAPHGFHHSSLAEAATRFESALQRYPAGLPEVRVHSPILGRPYNDDDRFDRLLARHLVMPVAFSAALRTLRAEGLTRIVECGALNSLGKIAIRVLGPGSVQVFSTFEQHTPVLQNLRKFTQLQRQEPLMTASLPSSAVFADFESFWNERSPFLMTQIKNEFLRFVEAEHARHMAAQPQVNASAPAAVPQPAAAAPKASAAIPRDQLFAQLVAIYAEAMEYPTEVFTEAIELEAELGIDSVKQTEIIGRISSAYGLPPLPATFRSGDFKTMGQIVDFVFSMQNQAAVAVQG